MKKYFIVGSCVSRDMLEFLPNSEYELVDYHARSSFATLNSLKMPIIYNESLLNIPSSFQRRMVEYDFNRTRLEAIINKFFDILLIDLIDERFHLAVFDKVYRATRSTEFIKTELKQYSVINSHSKDFLSYWEQGIDLFFSILIKNELIQKVRIQKAYWTNIIDNGSISDKYSDDMIKKENDKLNYMYKYLEKYLSIDQFIVIPPHLIQIKSNHKWGISPFHYIDDYYKYIITKI
ncbi:DUF6270 domain-containing protein [Acinetobacter thermotolerans]|uniref:DUF6270 domain-containing protein n=1 Tax=Acinetobacter thermotolerans TaxID=3151487 RepID=UPI00325A445F